MAAMLEVDYKTVLHHLRMLEHVGLVMRAGSGQKRYFGVGQISHSHATLHADVLSNPATNSLLVHLRQHGSADLPSICGDLGLAKSTVSIAAKRLRTAGLVERRREHRRVVLSLVHRDPTPGATSPPAAGEAM